MNQIYEFEEKWVSSNVIDWFTVSTILAIDIRVSRVDFKILIDQIYKIWGKMIICIVMLWNIL